jgi:cytochrome c peroxidase
VTSRLIALALCLAGLQSASTAPLGLDAYLPVPDGNPLTAEKIDLGRRLFFDRRLSRDGSIACVTCHDPNRAFADGRALSIGVDGRIGRRSAPALINRGYGRLFFWDGRARSLEEQVLTPIADLNEMDSPVDQAAARVGVTVQDIALALASFVRTLRSGNSPFDRYIAGDQQALSDGARHGLEVFRGKGRCVTCHIGPNFTDEKLHNTGVAWNGERFTDSGAGVGDFKTPTLREVALTAPYMHDGSLPTLEDVVDFYDRGGNPNPALAPEIRPLNLTTDEKRALVSFLRSLSGDVVSGGPDQ